MLEHLSRKPGHDEVKSDFRQLLIEEFGAELDNLDFERRVPEVRGRIDALIGRTVFEAKSDIDREWQDVVRRMPDYLADREREEGEPFVGVASDGRKWVIFERKAGELEKVKETVLDPAKSDEFLAWLDGALALKSSLYPEPLTIKAELGQDSIAFRRAEEALRELWDELEADPAVALKRQLWASLLKLVYGKDVENEALWFQHTYLVIVAKAIATAVLDVREDDPMRMLSGAAIQAASIFGAVESDFFDWPIAAAKGQDLVRRIMNHVRRFRLREVQSDVLKVLYESLIDRSERHGLGEYYTPDWLAAKIVRHAVERPTQQHVLDPACGSGTFLFHAIRNFLAEAEDAGMAVNLRAAEITDHVIGMDIHPVAVIIARVTYLLALAPALPRREGSLSIPVYLGDAMQLSITQMLGGKELTINVPPPAAGQSQSGKSTGNGETLDFPETFCRDPRLFDKAIEAMRAGSLQDLTRRQVEASLVRITEQHFKRDINAEEEKAIVDLGKTYEVFDRLRREGRDSVWAYVARNLSRPLSLSASGGWAHVIVGNPPWVAFRHMSADLQKRFKQLANAERIYVGGKFATQNDLAALFFVRAAALYLRSGGDVAMVLPLAALTRGQFERFRTGSFDSTSLRYTAAWTMDDSVRPLFPVPSCVVFGRKQATSRPLPATVTAYTGELPYRDAPESIADEALSVEERAPAPREGSFEGGSNYRRAFRQGATLVPRMLCLVERREAGRLGGDMSMPSVVSRRSSQEKKPWKSLPGIEGRIEIEFLRPVLLGESILPFRVLRPFEAVIAALADGVVLDAEAAATRGLSGLHEWMTRAESLWGRENDADTMSLVERWNYHNELGAQFPVGSTRVVFTASGTIPAAVIVRDQTAIVEHSLYWMAVRTEAEGQFLCSIIGSEAARKRVNDLQAKGQWGARHFDKVMFTLPIPLFDATITLHSQLADVSAEAERVAASVPLAPDARFQAARKKIRDALADAGVSQRIDALVDELLGPVLPG